MATQRSRRDMLKLESTPRIEFRHDLGMKETNESALATTMDADRERVCTAIVEGMTEFSAIFDGGLRIVGVNRSLCDVLGFTAQELLGMSALDLLAPGSQDRAAILLGVAIEQGAVAGAAPYDLVCADGSALTVQVTGFDIRIDGEEFIVVIGRPAYKSVAMGLVIDRLLANDDLEQILEPLLEQFAWRQTYSGVAITWSTNGTWHSVSTSLPDELTGIGRLAPGGPWAKALELGKGIQGSVDQLLDTDERAVAKELGFGQLWVEPVTTVSATPDAMITVFMVEGGYPPLVHRLGVDETRRYLSVVLRWTDALRRLEDDARRDDLTGLANRRSFFDGLSAANAGGAILFADLDGFKGVNDQWGHAVGDSVLIEVGRRIAAAAGPDVCVARVGGDEFAVVLPDATAADAAEVAERIRCACAEPIDIEDISITMGISVGLAVDPTDLGAAALRVADLDQYAEKRRRRTDL